MKIGLVNSVILNGGDAGIVYGTCDAIAEALPLAKFTVFVHHARAALKYFGDLNLTPMVFDTWPSSRVVRMLMRKTYLLRHSLGLRTGGERRFLSELKSCDVIVYCGGGYLNDSYDMQLLFDIIEVSLGTGIPHMAYAHSIGPIRRAGSAHSARRLLSRFDLITARDEATFALLRQLGIPLDRVELLADAALAMHVEQGDTISDRDREAMREIQDFKAKNAGPLIFMSVRSWRFPGERDAPMQAQTLWSQLECLTQEILATTNWSICFVSTCQGRSEYGYDDSSVAHDVVSRVDDRKRVMVSNHAFAPRSLPYLIRTCADLVISMRMHLTIFSLLAGVPFVAIAYEKKSVELCRRLGIEEFCHEASGLEGLVVARSARRLFGMRMEMAESLRQKCEELISLSRQNAHLLKTRCLPGRVPPML